MIFCTLWTRILLLGLVTHVKVTLYMTAQWCFISMFYLRTLETWMVMDTSPVELGSLQIEGVLEIDGTSVGSGRKRRSVPADINLVADHILIMGGRLIVGWPDNPTTGNVNIILKGSHSTVEYSSVNGPNLGAKFIGEFWHRFCSLVTLRLHLWPNRENTRWTALSRMIGFKTTVRYSLLAITVVHNWPVSGRIPTDRAFLSR